MFLKDSNLVLASVSLCNVQRWAVSRILDHKDTGITFLSALLLHIKQLQAHLAETQEWVRAQWNLYFIWKPVMSIPYDYLGWGMSAVLTCISRSASTVNKLRNLEQHHSFSPPIQHSYQISSQAKSPEAPLSHNRDELFLIAVLKCTNDPKPTKT